MFPSAAGPLYATGREGAGATRRPPEKPADPARTIRNPDLLPVRCPIRVDNYSRGVRIASAAHGACSRGVGGRGHNAGGTLGSGGFTSYAASASDHDGGQTYEQYGQNHTVRDSPLGFRLTVIIKGVSFTLQEKVAVAESIAAPKHYQANTIIVITNNNESCLFGAAPGEILRQGGETSGLFALHSRHQAA